MGKGLSGIMGPIYDWELDADDWMGPIYDSELDFDDRMSPIYVTELDFDNRMGPIYDSELDADDRMGPIYVTELDSYQKQKHNMRIRRPNGEKRHWVILLYQCFSAIRFSNLLYNYMRQNGR